MTSTGTLKRLKQEWQYTCSLIALQTQTYDTLVKLSLKSFIRALVLAFKFPNTIFVASFLFLSINTA